MGKNRLEVNGLDKSGKSVACYVVKPTPEVYVEAQNYANKIFGQALNGGAVFRDNLVSHMIKQNLWSQEKEDEENRVDELIQENVNKLKKGGIKLSEAKNVALAIRILRFQKLQLSSRKTELDAWTVEGQAENARFDYLVYACLVDEEGNKLFKSVDDYKNHGDEDYVIKAATKLAILTNNVDEDWQKKLPENEFLLKYKLVDDKLRLVDKDGHYIDVNGHKVNEQGFKLNEDGLPVDDDGNLVDENGQPIIESQPFLDDEGNPIL